MRLGRRMLELDASVTVASLRRYLTALRTEQVVLRVAQLSMRPQVYGYGLN